MKSWRLAKKGEHIRQHWRRVSLHAFLAAAGTLIAAQLALPWGDLPLYETIDGANVGGMSKNEAIRVLDGKYRQMSVNLYFGNTAKPYRQPHPADIGLTISSQPEVEAVTYPLWLRLIPTSLWWAQNVTAIAAPKYSHDAAKADAYIKKELGTSCDVTSQNATLAYKDKKLQVVPAVDGGSCKLPDVTKSLENALPLLSEPDLRFALTPNPVKIHDDKANSFAEKLMAKTANVSIKAGDGRVAIPQDTLLSWLDFKAPDSGLVATVNSKRAAAFFDKQLTPKVAVAAGTTRVSYVDFTETGRVNGASGQKLNEQATIDMLNQWLSGLSVNLVAQVTVTAPTITYLHSYTATNTGLAALLTNFAQTHAGVYGVGYAELTGQHRHAGYNDTTVFETASTYKLFVAYGTLKRVQAGVWHWSDQIEGGKNLTRCFNDMIELSDNDCAVALLHKIGYAQLTKEIQAAGFTHSSFLGDYIQTTPSDLVAYLGMLQSGQLLTPSSTSTLLSAMRGNIYRQGVPSGTAGTVADKVGFLYPGYVQGVPGTVNLLHDASIVYDPGGTYVLVVMTGNSSWGTIAQLTSQIEAWRASN